MLRKCHSKRHRFCLFSLPISCSEKEQERMKSDLWDEYVKNGGNSKAYPSFKLTEDKLPKFLEAVKRADILAEIQKEGRLQIVSKG